MSDTRDTVTACPSCNSCELYERETLTPQWLCLDCREQFEEPVRRPPIQPGGEPEYMTDACPSCESAQSLYERKNKKPRWICHVCGHEFDEPMQRPAIGGHEAGHRSPLVDMDPEEVP